MKLSSFVEETIFEIALGIHSAKVKAKDLVAVSPGKLDGEKLTEKSYVDFDVSLAVKEASSATTAAKGGAGASIQVASLASINFGGEGGKETETGSETEQLHRVSFRVPVYFNAEHRNDPGMDREAELIGRIKAEQGED